MRQKIYRYILHSFDIIAIASIFYAFYNYSPEKFALQLFFIMIIVLVKISPRKVYDTVYVGLELPIYFSILHIFSANILSIPIVIFFVADTIKTFYRGGYRKIKNSLENFKGTLKLIIPLLTSAIVLMVLDFQNMEITIHILAGFFTYSIFNVLILYLTLSVYKNMKLFQIIDNRWIILYFTLQCFFTILIIEAYDYFGLNGLFFVYAASVITTNILNKSISIEKHQVIYKETLDYFVDFYKYAILILDQNFNILSVNKLTILQLRK